MINTVAQECWVANGIYRVPFSRTRLLFTCNIPLWLWFAEVFSPRSTWRFWILYIQIISLHTREKFESISKFLINRKSSSPNTTHRQPYNLIASLNHCNKVNAEQLRLILRKLTANLELLMVQIIKTAGVSRNHFQLMKRTYFSLFLVLVIWGFKRKTLYLLLKKLI